MIPPGSALVLMCGMLAGGCAADRAGPVRAPAINHVVLITLADETQAPALVAESRARLARIPGVRTLHVGTPLDIGRPGVDGAYSVAVAVGFDSVEAYRAYLDHPEHLALLEAWKPRCRGIRVIDAAANESSSARRD